MNLNEMYFLNSILDDKDILFIPRPPDSEMSMLLLDAVKDGLIKKGLLKSETEFTDEGIRYARRLLNFKEAKKHVRIDNIILGINDQSESVMIIYNPLFEDYDIRVVDSANSAEQIVESIPFFNYGETSAQGDSINLGFEDFQKRFKLNLWNHFRLSVWQEHISKDEIYFLNENTLYRYDCIAETLYQECKQHILNCLAERMVLA